MKPTSPRARTRRPSPAAHIEASYHAAQKLHTIGMPVIVERDGGQLENSTLTALPWTLGHGAWVAKVAGISGCYCTTRIRPA